MREAIVPTVTHRVRGFLASQGVIVRPWSGLDETYTELYALMRRRRDDPELWEPLRGLLAAIVEATPGREAELLGSWDLDALVADLRRAIPAEGGASLASFTRGLSAPVLGGFLLIGLVAAGCGSATGIEGDATAEGDAADTTEAVDTADDVPSWAEGCELDRSSVLFRTLLASELPDWDKQNLCTCFAGLNASWNDGLTELFRTGTPDVIAAALNEMIECCNFDPSRLDADYEAVRDAFLDGTLCWMALPYRGVSFPGR